MTHLARRIVAAAFLAAGASLGVFASPAGAGVTDATINGDGAASKLHIASYVGTVSYNSETHKLTFAVVNATPVGNVTGVAFNLKAGVTAAYRDGDDPATKADEDAYDQLRTKKGVAKIKSFGAYAVGATIDGKWGGGKPTQGIPFGQSHRFVFDLTGASDSDTVTTLLGPGTQTLVASFKGLRKKKSDAVGAFLDPLPGYEEDLAIAAATGSGETGVPVVGGDNSLPPVASEDRLPTKDELIPLLGGPVAATGHAVPLPPAAWTGLATLALAGLAAARRKVLAAV